MTKTCTMPDCNQPHSARGFCIRHYAQLQKGMISPEGVVLRAPKRIPKKFQAAQCKHPDCSEGVRTRGWCNKHYLQLRIGIIDEDNKQLRDPKRRPGRGWKTYMRGYIKVMAIGHPHADRDGYVLQHRLVMEKVLGRYLTKAEIVHHKDGNRANNDPSNLEVCTRKTHPPAHEYTVPLLHAAMTALRHNNPDGYAELMTTLLKEP